MSENIYDRLTAIEHSIKNLKQRNTALDAEAAVKESPERTIQRTNFSAADRLALLKMAAEATRDSRDLAAVEETFKRLAAIVGAR